MNQSSAPETEIQPADPAARARAIWTIVAVTALAGSLVLALQFREEQINDWVAENTQALVQHPGIVFLITFVLMLPLVGAAIYMYRLADRIVRAQRMPPPGQKVIKDTPVITGRKAVRQGRGLKVMASLMGLFGLLLPFGLTLILMLLNKSN